MSSLTWNSAATLLAAIWLCLSNWAGIGHAAEKDPEPNGRRPNVLLICVDDLKPIARCYGGTARTPHLDRLAARGVLFESAYCNQAVCAPSRNALLTGLRPQTLGIYDLGTNFRRSRPDAVTLPQHFKQHGWRAEALGKIFHVGHGNNEDPASWSAPHWRANVVAYALPESRAKKGLTREEALFSNQPAANLPRGAAYEAADVPDNAYPDGAIADEVVKRLAAFKDRPGEPFFLAVGFVKPHLPFCAPKKYWDLYKRDDFALPEHRAPPKGAPRYAPTNWGELRQYRDMPESGTLSGDQERTLIHGYHAATSYMDSQLGRVLDALDENRLAENTVVVLWGDHGWHLGDHGMWCKHTNYEQAARIPLIVMAPGAIPGGRSKSLVESVDVYPTLCELTGLEAPNGLDGKSFAETLKRPTTAVEDFAFHVYPRGQRIGRAVRTSRHRLVEWKVPGAPAESAELELYDYEMDPGETTNVAGDQSEKATELRAILARQPEARPQIAAGGQNAEKSREISNRQRKARNDGAKDTTSQTPRGLQRGIVRYGIFETEFEDAGDYANPYTELDAKAELRRPDDSTWTMPLFWNGGNSWKLRASPDLIGQWSFKIRSTDRGLDGKTGSFFCYGRPRSRGSIRPMDGFPRHFQYQNGERMWFMGDTAWGLLTDKAEEKHDRSAAEAYLRERAGQGFNVVTSMMLSEAGWGNSGGLPFDEIGAEKINPGYWKEVDQRLAFANEQGLVVGLAIAWGDKRKQEPFAWRKFPDLEARKRYARYIAARYSAYDVYFIVSGEWHGEVRTRPASEEAMKREFIEIGDALAAADPHDRMMAIHPMTSHGSVREFNDAAWMSFGDYQQNYQNLHARVLESRETKKAVVNSEYGYYLRDQSGDGVPDKDNSTSLEAMRHATWDIVMAGGYVVSGFGTTYFGGNRDPGPFELEAAKNDAWEVQIGLMKRLFTELEWWKLSPHDELLSCDTPRGKDRKESGQTAPPSTAYWCLAEPGKQYLIYARGLKQPVTLNIGGSSSGWTARQLNPRDGKRESLKANVEQGRFVYKPPDEQDWVVLLVRENEQVGEVSAPAFPLKVSENRRYLVDQRGRPFFFHADTAWQLPKRLKREDVEAYLDDRQARGFNAILIQSFSKEVTPLANAYGEVPFDESENILKPNEAYWRHVDFVIQQAARRGFAVAMAPIWIRWGGDDKHGWRNHLTDENARPYGEFVGRRYARFDNLLWILGGDANPKEKTEAIRSLARGIKAQAPNQLIMVHNAPEHASAKFFGDDNWLDVNMAYSYKEVYPQILGEWTGARPVRPILLGESGYEEESNDKRGGDPWRMRRQAYQALLAGALGGHAFGQKHIWRFDDEWRGALDSPGSRQMTHVKALFASRPWHLLEPDHAGKLLVEGQGKLGEVEYVVAARASDGSFAVAYFPTTMTVKFNLSELSGAIKAHWYDPNNGKSQAVADFSGGGSRTASVTPPQKNSAGDPDWVLLLDVSTSDAGSSKGK